MSSSCGQLRRTKPWARLLCHMLRSGDGYASCKKQLRRSGCDFGRVRIKPPPNRSRECLPRQVGNNELAYLKAIDITQSSLTSVNLQEEAAHHIQLQLKVLESYPAGHATP